MPYLQVFWHFGELGQIDTIVLNAKQLMDHCLRGNPDPDPKHFSGHKFKKCQPISYCYCWISCNDKQSQMKTTAQIPSPLVGQNKLLAFIALKRQSSEGEQVLAPLGNATSTRKKTNYWKVRTWFISLQPAHIWSSTWYVHWFNSGVTGSSRLSTTKSRGATSVRRKSNKPGSCSYINLCEEKATPSIKLSLFLYYEKP